MHQKILHHYQGVGSARDIFRGSGFIPQMDCDFILLFSKCYENTQIYSMQYISNELV